MIRAIRNNFSKILFWSFVLPVIASGQTPNTSIFPPLPTQTLQSLLPAYSGTIPLNYVREWSASKTLSSSTAISSTSRTLEEVKQSTQYYDGLGRPVQTVGEKVSPLGFDMVSSKTYDEFGREVFNYLPYISPSSDGNFKTNAFTEDNNFLKAFYNPTNNTAGEQFFYGKTDYENSPANRAIKSYAPGNSWVGSGVGTSMQYFNNTLADSVRIWNVNFNSGKTPTSTGFYAAGLLSKNITTDERGYDVVQYTNKSGKLILKKVAASNTTYSGPTNWLNTYYIYDDLGNLRYVIQPKGTDWLKSNNWTFENTSWANSTIAKEFTFSYEYDARNRMIIKRVPGAGEVWMVYDTRDRLVMTQDSSLRQQGKWLYTSYDAFNRPVLNGSWTDANDRGYHQALAYNSENYPNPSTGFEVLTSNYYDNYSWVSSSGSGLSSTIITANGITGTNYFYAQSNNTFPFPQAITADYTNITGRMTGTKTKVLGSANTYLWTISFYDNRGRLIETQSINNSGGKDTVVMQYSFSGQVLRTLECHSKSGTNPQQYRVLTKMTYDAGGRLTTVNKVTGNSPETVIAQNQYDELGQLKKKVIGQKRDAINTNTYTSDHLDSLAYSYNVRGWLRGINKDYARGENNAVNWFGTELNYDFGFTTTQLNGNIAGIRWRSAGDGEQRAYGFTYDPVNRLKKANFTQYTSANWDVSAGIDFTLKNMSYDANGNITSMSQNGLVLSTSSIIDSLTYGYINNTNRLKYVTDAANNPTSTLGDFKEVNNNTTQDYWYDGNGNLTKDNNKSISSISYNYLNLPQTITFTGKGTITYTYDAAGNKLKKVTVDNNALPAKTTTTDYMGSFIYQNDTLQFISSEGGRTRPATAGKTDTMYYDYFEKDHLGNIRIVLTDQKQQDVYPVATVESQNAAALAIEKQYYDIQDANIVDTSSISGFVQNTATYKNNNGNPPYNTNPSANTGQVSKKLYKLNGQQGVKTGLGITLRVMSGDVVDVYGKSYWHSNGLPIQNTYNISSALMNFLGLFAGSHAVALGGHGTDATTLFNTPNTTFPLGNWLNNSVPDPGVNIPKAYINWILFDEQFIIVSSSSGFSGVNATGDVLKTHHNNVSIPKNGYLYVYCSNESNVDVFFDNLQVIHTRGPLIEETHYYPFGLTMAGISSKAAGSLTNKFQFLNKEKQSNEFSDGSGLDMYDLSARFYDTQIGRFGQIDPLAEYMRRWSPYVYGFDNPVRFADGNGAAPGDSTEKSDVFLNPDGTEQVKTLPEVTVTSSKDNGGFWGGVSSFLWGAVDYIPFAGSIKEIGVGIYNGDWKQIGMGVVMLGVDAFTAGEGGELIRVGKNLGKELVEQEVKEIAERELIEQTEKKVVQETGYYADEYGNVISKNQDEAYKSLEKGGYEKAETRKGGEGVVFKDVVTKSGKKVEVRLMKEGKGGGTRAVTNHPGTNSGKTLNGATTPIKNNYHFPQH